MKKTSVDFSGKKSKEEDGTNRNFKLDKVQMCCYIILNVNDFCLKNTKNNKWNYN